MRTDTTTEAQQKQWRELSRILDRVQRVGLRGLSPDEILDLGSLYRRAAADLARSTGDADAFSYHHYGAVSERCEAMGHQTSADQALTEDWLGRTKCRQSECESNDARNERGIPLVAYSPRPEPERKRARGQGYRQSKQGTTHVKTGFTTNLASTIRTRQFHGSKGN